MDNKGRLSNKHELGISQTHLHINNNCNSAHTSSNHNNSFHIKNSVFGGSNQSGFNNNNNNNNINTSTNSVNHDVNLEIKNILNEHKIANLIQKFGKPCK